MSCILFLQHRLLDCVTVWFRNLLNRITFVTVLVYSCSVIVSIATGSGVRVSKLQRLSQPDDKLGDGIDYTYVEDKTKFVADDATLRFASVAVFESYMDINATAVMFELGLPIFTCAVA